MSGNAQTFLRNDNECGLHCMYGGLGYCWRGESLLEAFLGGLFATWTAMPDTIGARVILRVFVLEEFLFSCSLSDGEPALFALVGAGDLSCFVEALCCVQMVLVCSFDSFLTLQTQPRVLQTGEDPREDKDGADKEAVCDLAVAAIPPSCTCRGPSEVGVEIVVLPTEPVVSFTTVAWRIASSVSAILPRGDRG